MALTANMLAVYKVYKENKLGSPADAWDSCNYMIRGTMKSIPRIIRKFMKNSGFTKRTIEQYKKDEKILKRNNAEDQIDFHEYGENSEYAYKINIKKCAKMKFVKKLGLEEFAPYICQIDRIFAEELGFCLVRTQTIADGGEFCDFKMKKDGKPKVTSPVWEKRWDKENFEKE